MDKKVKQFNMLIIGTGGQGLITLLQILAEAALFEGYDVKTSELHGLSQRGGSVEVHLRFGKKIFSPLIPQGKADLILGLEMQECLKACYYANSKTEFLVNKHIVPVLSKNPLPEKEVLKILQRFSRRIEMVPAAEICQKQFRTNVVAGIYLLSLASLKKLMPLKPTSILKAIKKIIPEKYLELNLRTFKLTKSLI